MAAEIPGVDVDNIKEVNIPGVDDDVADEESKISGVGSDAHNNEEDNANDNKTENTGVGNNAHNNNEEEIEHRIYQTMNLRNQRRKEYNVFNNNGEEEIDSIMLLELNQENTDLEESELDRMDAEYTFLTGTLTPRRRQGRTRYLGWTHGRAIRQYLT